MDIFTGLDQNNQAAFGLQYLGEDSEEGVYAVRGWMLNNGQQTFTKWVTISNALNQIELAWNSGAKGGFSLYVNTGMPVTMSGNTSAHQLSQITLGPSNGLSADSEGTMYFAQFSSLRVNGVEYDIVMPFLATGN